MIINIKSPSSISCPKWTWHSIKFFSTKSHLNQTSESFLKKSFNNLLRFLFGCELYFNLASALYQKYTASFGIFVNSRIPFIAALKMPKESHKSVREEMGLDGSANGDQHDGFDATISRNFDEQAEISTTMLQMTRSLKASSLSANHLIKRDIRALGQAKDSTESNMAALKQTSDKLSDCSRSGMNWWLIVLVVIVFMIFILMVFLMRVLKKNL